MKYIFLFVVHLVLLMQSSAQSTSRWTPEQANAWFKKQPFLAGANYLPVSAINQLEMFGAETFDTATIHKEMKLAQSIGFNTMRVFLHDLLWKQDAAGFKRRLDTFLRICAQYGVKPMLVFFDSCWDPYPRLGKQRKPIPGLHNSGWVQSPGSEVLGDSTQWGYLEQYVKDMVRSFSKDQRILCWDVWNEPDNPNTSSYSKFELGNKVAFVAALLPKVFAWARSAAPTQPLTSGVWTAWTNAWSRDSISKRSATEVIQFENSDIITFHSYGKPAEFERYVKELQGYNRPVICTEYMARGEGNTVITIMPIGKKYNVGLINWGFADGKEQTKFPWDSWSNRYPGEPPLWHHVLFNKDYSPYKPEEIEAVKKTLK